MGENCRLRYCLTGGGDDGQGVEEWRRARLLDEGEHRLRDILMVGGGDGEGDEEWH